jgi:S1-C subfamily serine protease
MGDYPKRSGGFFLAIAWSIALSFIPGPGASGVTITEQVKANKGDGGCRSLVASSRPVSGQAEVKQPFGSSEASGLRAREEILSEPSAGASIGTAWPLTSGYVVTNNHVVSESNEVILIDKVGQQMRAWAVIRDEANDIALLEVSDSRELPPALPLANSQARLGSSVFTIGFPRLDVMGRTPKLFNGVISGINGLRDDPEKYQTTVPIQPGNSGGPLLNMKGEVVGIITSMLGVRDPANGDIDMLQNASCALKIQSVKDLLAHLPRHDAVIDALPSHYDNLETLAERIKDSVLIVIAR